MRIQPDLSGVKLLLLLLLLLCGQGAGQEQECWIKGCESLNRRTDKTYDKMEGSRVVAIIVTMVLCDFL